MATRFNSKTVTFRSSARILPMCSSENFKQKGTPIGHFPATVNSVNVCLPPILTCKITCYITLSRPFDGEESNVVSALDISGNQPVFRTFYESKFERLL